jgi:hypothetical protein
MPSAKTLNSIKFLNYPKNPNTHRWFTESPAINLMIFTALLYAWQNLTLNLSHPVIPKREFAFTFVHLLIPKSEFLSCLTYLLLPKWKFHFTFTFPFIQKPAFLSAFTYFSSSNQKFAFAFVHPVIPKPEFLFTFCHLLFPKCSFIVSRNKTLFAKTFLIPGFTPIAQA